MRRSELTDEKIEAWRQKLPADILFNIPKETPGVAPERLDALADDLASASSRRVFEVLTGHAETLCEIGRARRVRILAWAVPRVWPDGTELTRRLVEDSGDGEDGGRSKIAPYFRADLEALGDVAMSRVLRAGTDRRTVDAVAGGVRDFDMSYNLVRTGGM